MLREHIEGPDAPYVQMYHKSLDGLLKQLGNERTENQKPETMTDGEWKAIDLALYAGHSDFIASHSDPISIWFLTEKETKEQI